MTERTAPVQQLSPLVGSWTIESPQFPGIPGGSATFEWIEDGAYLLHRSFAPDPVPDGIMIVGGDDDVDSANLTMLYHDSRGVSRVYRTSFTDGTWRMWRDCPGFNQRFTGSLDDTGQTLHGRWETSADGSTWTLDFELIYQTDRAAEHRHQLMARALGPLRHAGAAQAGAPTYSARSKLATVRMPRIVLQHRQRSRQQTPTTRGIRP